MIGYTSLDTARVYVESPRELNDRDSPPLTRTCAVATGALMADKLRAVCDFLFFGAPMPQDDEVRHLLD